MRASRQQLPFAWSVLFPSDYFTALRRCRICPVACGRALTLSPGWVAMVPRCRARHCPRRGSAAGMWP